MRRFRNKFANALAAAAVAWACPQALAQAVTPGQVNDSLKPPPGLTPPPQPEVRVDTPAPVRVVPVVQAGEALLVVKTFEFTGNALFSERHLSEQLKSYVGRRVTLADLYEAADRIATFYNEQGYTLATVNLPPQKVSDGKVLLQISEGRVASVVIEGDERYQAEHLRRYLGAFRSGEIYRADSLQQGLRSLSALPGLNVKATVRPGQSSGDSEVVLTLDERKLQGGVTVDNFGRESVGEYRLTAAATLNNPLGVEDQLQLTGVVSEQALTRYGALLYSIPLNFVGTRLRLGYSHAEFEIDDSPVDGRSRNGELTVEHPVVNDARQRLLLSFGAVRTLSNADFSGLVFNQTSITLLRLGLAYTLTHDNAAVTQVNSAMSSNFDSLSIEDFAGGEVEGNQRLKWDLDVQHLMPLARSLQLYVRTAGAWSPDPLVDTEKFSLGGPGSVRGFPSAEVRGDYGYFGSVSLQHLSAWSGMSLRSRLFADSGAVFSVDAPDAGSLSSVGIGFDLTHNPLSMRIDWAYPLGNREASDGQDSGRLFGSLAATF
jgi:hemolysin activation/secretion protein